jgi:hypothetical protein
LLLLAAAHSTGLVTTLTTAVSASRPPGESRLTHLRLASLQSLLLTLLFLAVVGLRRTWDLRSYTGDALALLSGRLRAYGYRHVERFLSQVATTGGVEALTDALAGFTTSLWKATIPEAKAPLTVYIDGLSLPVYSEHLIPRGLIGRTGAIEGCRALVLLHDAQGHPLLVTTHRGDLHLTSGLPQILDRYQQATGRELIVRIIVDREGMAAEFLAGLVAAGHTVITVLRSDQYKGLESFTEVGAFVPLVSDQQSTVVREVAPARFALPLPDHPGQILSLSVALIRDLRRQMPAVSSEDVVPGVHRWYSDLDLDARNFWEQGWTPTPAPATPTQAKLIPIVSTASTSDPVVLARLYMHRWPVQENIIRDWLITLGIDTNHGYAKTEVVNSEVAKQRTALEQKRSTLERWAQGARQREDQASKRYHRLHEQTNAHAKALYRVINDRQSELEVQEVPEYLLRREIREMKAIADADIKQRQAKMWRAYEQSNQEANKVERYCRKLREVLRALEDLAAHERTMYELDHAKDQVMAICKVALANLVMWTRDQYFPATYAQATWKRIAPFFQLAGRVRWEPEVVQVELRPFNDAQLNRDLDALCMRVATAQPRLPDGQRLVFTVGPPQRLSSDLYQQQLE